ncbi:hypothetical protein SASPL_126654 [Salvia splendens]|uniref:BAG domain-containing protein n=1 Tax=Salvia splendens TaxID=180675 RepID=A0A8X8ZRX9_SALSN|nr:hypothetical protein SASPL_126654 [Salvia splendens]
MTSIETESGFLRERELRPGGMLVQKRTDNAPPPTIRVRVKYASIYHQIHISSQATFGVKDKSKMVLEEDPISLEKRYLEMRKTAIMEKAAKIISHISLEVDRLGAQLTHSLIVSALESVVSRGGNVADKDVATLVEMLMNQLLKLECISYSADADVKLQRKMQVRRVHKYVEALDSMKTKKHPEIEDSPNPGQQPAVFTTEWEMFDSIPTTAAPGHPSNFTWNQF